jgi:hypothetical protein
MSPATFIKSITKMKKWVRTMKKDGRAITQRDVDFKIMLIKGLDGWERKTLKDIINNLIK